MTDRLSRALRPHILGRAPRMIVGMAILGAAVLAISFAPVGRTRPAEAHNHEYGNCANRYWYQTPPDQHIYYMIYYTAVPYCYQLPAGTQSQQTYYQSLPDTYWGVGGWYWAYAYHGSSENVQHQLDGPTCKSYWGISCSGDWNWWGYWYYYNPTGWWQQQQNTYSGGPYWHRQGYY